MLLFAASRVSIKVDALDCSSELKPQEREPALT
jgi:hypothetical protein